MIKLHQSKKVTLIIFTLILVISYFVFSPGFYGGYIFDDSSNLFNLKIFNSGTGINKYIDYLNSFHSGVLKRPITTFSFLINAQDWPADPYYFKVTNYIIHVINGLLLYIATKFIFKLVNPTFKSIKLVALISSLIWLFHPFFISTVFYIVQRMAMLPVTFTLLGIIFYCKGRMLLSSNFKKSIFYMFLGVYFFTALATLSKENGVLLPILIILLELTAVKNHKLQKLSTQISTFLFYIPITIITAAIIYKMPEFIGKYEHREFTLVERLLSECRVLSTYIYHLIIPGPFTEGVFTDGFKKSIDFFNPVSTFYSFLFIFSTIAIALKYKNKYPLASFAILFFYLAHLLESTFIPLELYFEHRNYLPALFLPLPISYLLVSLYHKNTNFLIIPFLLISFLAYNSYLRSKLWGDNLNLHIQTSLKFPESVRASTISAAMLSERNMPGPAIKVLTKALQFNQNIELISNLLNLKCFTGLLTQNDFNQIKAILEKSTFKITDNMPFNNLINTLLTDKCLIKTKEYVPELLNIVEKNKGYEDKIIKYYTYYNYAKYYAITGKSDKSIDYIKIIISDSKNVHLYNISSDLVGVFINNADYLAAEKVLELLQPLLNELTNKRNIFLLDKKIKNFYLEIKNNQEINDRSD